MTRLCTICARGGSKGVPGKNTRLLQGKPLIAHSIEQALESKLFQTVAVSSDSDTILEVAGQWGAEHLIRRPDELATDAAPKLPAIRHCVSEVERRIGVTVDVVVDLDATSPLRTVDDIRAVLVLLEEGGAGNVITGTPARRSPYFNLVEVSPDGSVTLCKPPEKPLARRQDGPACYDMNASIYAWSRGALESGDTLFHPDTRLYVMPEERSLDIDSELDFRMVELLMEQAGDR